MTQPQEPQQPQQQNQPGVWQQLLGEIVVGDDRFIDRQGNWAAMSSTELYNGVHQNADPAKAHDRAAEWEKLGSTMSDHTETLADALHKHTANWSGGAASSAKAAIYELVNWGRQASKTSNAIAKPLRQQGDILATARASMPEPVEVDHDAMAKQAFGTPGLGGLAQGLSDAQPTSAQAAKVHQQAVDAMNTMEESSRSIDNAVPQFIAPKSVTAGGSSGAPVPLQPASVGIPMPAGQTVNRAPTTDGKPVSRPPTVPGGQPGGQPCPACGSPGGVHTPQCPIAHPGGAQGPAPAGRPAAVNPGGGAPAGHGPVEGGPGPEMGHTGTWPNGQPVSPQSGPPSGQTDPSSIVPPGGMHPGSSFPPDAIRPGSSFGPGGSSLPGGSNAGWHGDITGALSANSGSGGGSASGIRSGLSGSGSGGSGAGAGAESTRPGAGGRSGAVAGGAEEAAGRGGAAGAAKPGGSGAPMGGGRGGKKEDDKEHKSKGYLQEEDDVFAVPEADRLPPPVIGGTPPKKRPPAPNA